MYTYLSVVGFLASPCVHSTQTLRMYIRRTLQPLVVLVGKNKSPGQIVSFLLVNHIEVKNRPIVWKWWVVFTLLDQNVPASWSKNNMRIFQNWMFANELHSLKMFNISDSTILTHQSASLSSSLVHSPSPHCFLRHERLQLGKWSGVDPNCEGLALLPGISGKQSSIYGGFQKKWYPPQISHSFIGFSIIFTIHFGVPVFLETPKNTSLAIQSPCQMMIGVHNHRNRRYSGSITILRRWLDP